MLFTAYDVLDGKILICNDNLPSQQRFLVQRFPDKSMSVLTMAASLKMLLLQPGKLRHSRCDKKGMAVSGRQFSEKNLSGEKSVERKTLLEQKSLWRRDEMMQSFRHSTSLQTADSPEYKNKTREHEGTNKCGVGLSWSEIQEEEKGKQSFPNRLDRKASSKWAHKPSRTGNWCPPFLSSHLMAGTAPTVTASLGQGTVANIAKRKQSEQEEKMDPAGS